MGRRRNRGRWLLAVAVLGLAAAACGGGGDEEPGTAVPPTAAAPAPEPETAGDELPEDDLPALALALGDLPEGFAVRQEGFVEGAGEGIRAVYRRAFDPGEALLGTSVLADLQSDTVLFESSKAAEDALDAILAGLTGEAVEQNFASIVRSYTGLEPEELSGQTLASPVVADGAVVARAIFTSPVGRVEASGRCTRTSS